MTQYNIFFLLSLLSLSAFSSSCTPKYYGEKRFVCVCNLENCDTLDESRNLTNDIILMYESDASKYRLFKRKFDVESLLADENDQADLRIRINRTDLKQSIIGFGGAFTDSAGFNLNQLSAHLRNRLVKDYFGKDGLEYNMGRVPMAGTDFSNRPYTYDDVEEDFELKNFTLTKDDHQFKIPFIKEAMTLKPDLKLFAVPWTAPAWMKTSKKLTGLGILIGDPGSIYWKTWANYFVKFLDSYAQEGINFWGLSPENEPMAGLEPAHRLNAMGFSPWMMKDFLKMDLGPALKAAGYTKDKLKILIFDHNTDFVAEFSRHILVDPEAASYVSGIAYHWYGKHLYKELNKVHDLFPDYFLLSTEACEGWIAGQLGVSMGNWTRAENYASDIIEGLNHWSTGWVDWNLLLDEHGGPNWLDNIVDSPIIINKTTGEYYKQPMFYSLGHFSKFLPPGSTRLGYHVAKGKLGDKVKLTSFLTPREEMVLIVLNTNEEAASLVIDGFRQKPIRVTLSPRSLRTIITKAQ